MSRFALEDDSDDVKSNEKEMGLQSQTSSQSSQSKCFTKRLRIFEDITDTSNIAQKQAKLPDNELLN